MVMFQPVEPLPGNHYLSASSASAGRTQSQADLDSSSELARSKRQRQQGIHHNTIDADDTQMTDTIYPNLGGIPDEDEVLIQVRSVLLFCWLVYGHLFVGPTLIQGSGAIISYKVLLSTQMLQTSGATTYDQVVDFCISCKIPISRMLKLDLMRVIQEKLPTNCDADDMAMAVDKQI